MLLNPVHILFPIVAMVTLVVIVVVKLFRSRVRSVRRRDISLEYFKLFQGSEEPEEIRALSRHYANLFELPILFYVACIVAYVSVHVDLWLVALRDFSLRPLLHPPHVQYCHSSCSYLWHRPCNSRPYVADTHDSSCDIGIIDRCLNCPLTTQSGH